ncbi:hypothetical protein B0O99DRAFT_333678 [Bisporella sp. PMI_857]|nr:hypothetical protein B0O99DRAFT_333678 [Bisporella sp. PMI_857]
MTSIPARPRTNDLWARAAAKLSHEDRKNINFSCPDKLKILSDLHELTETSRQECINKRWRYKRKSGETVIFVDLFGKVIKWVDLFKQVGDIVVQYDPVHAALPWAGVRFLLQIAVNDFNKFSFVIESAELIAELICRCAIFEDVYLQPSSPVGDELQRALVNLYVAVMVYLSKVKGYFDQNLAKRALKSGLLAISDLETSFSAIAPAQEIVDRCSNIVGMRDHIEKHKELKELLGCINSPLKRLTEDFKRFKDGFETSKRAEILLWVSPEPYLQHHEQSKKEALSGTGQWLLEDPIFDRWKKESVPSILWLHGIPGSGKSKLVSIVIEDADKAFNAGQSPPPVFFYCSRNSAEPARSNPDAIVASIARQLSSLQPGLPLLPPMVAIYRKREAEGYASGSLRIDESRALIIQLVEHYPMTTIVIDALDECDPENRADLLETLEAVLRESSNLVKIFVSSRNDQDIVLHLQNYPNLELSSDRNNNDIALFVRAETKDLIRKRKLLHLSINKSELQEAIVEQVTKGANGMFRWASMQLLSLCAVKTDKAVRERLGQLPPKLEDFYLELYKRLTSSAADADREVTINAFSWLLCAQRTLAFSEFLAALLITLRRPVNRLTKEHILEICFNIVVFDSTLNIFRFAHLSVREFLEKRPEYSSKVTSTLAAEKCLLKIKRFTSNSGQASFGSALLYDFSKYSNFYWAMHCQLAADERTCGILKDFFVSFLSKESNPRSAVSI